MSSRQRCLLQPAFLLHRTPYRDTSLLLELITAEQGRIALVAKGARRPKSALNGLLQPFQPLLLSWGGRGDLGTLYGAETDGYLPRLRGERLYAGFYLNELLNRLLQRHLPCPELVARYRHTLSILAGEGDYLWALRLFERDLLTELGYGLQLGHDVSSGVEIAAEHPYSYILEYGPVASPLAKGQGVAISGAALLALNDEQVPARALIDECKRLLRMMLSLYLGDRPLASREMFKKYSLTPQRAPTAD